VNFNVIKSIYNGHCVSIKYDELGCHKLVKLTSYYSPSEIPQPTNN
jgi:hypothetical protein